MKAVQYDKYEGSAIREEMCDVVNDVMSQCEIFNVI